MERKLLTILDDEKVANTAPRWSYLKGVVDQTILRLPDGVELKTVCQPPSLSLPMLMGCSQYMNFYT